MSLDGSGANHDHLQAMSAKSATGDGADPTSPWEGTPSTTRKIIAGPGWKTFAFGGICETCKVTRPVSEILVYDVESSRYR